MMQRLGFPTLLIAILVLRSIPALAEEAVKSLPQAFGYAYLDNPELRAARAQVRATQEDYPIAVSGRLPAVEATTGFRQSWQEGDNISTGQDSGSTTETRLSLTQSLYRGGRTKAEIAEAEQRILADRQMLLNREQSLFLEVTREYMNVLRDRALLRLNENNERVLKAQMEAAIKRKDGGELAVTDVEQARARVAGARADTLEAQAALALSTSRFRQLVGRDVAENADIPPLATDLPPTLDAALLLALANNPEINELDYRYQAAKNTIAVRYSGLLPQVTLNASSRYEDDPLPGDKRYSRLDSIGVHVRVPLYTGGAVHGGVRKARYQAEQRQFELDERRREIRQRVISQWQDYEATKEAIASRQAQVAAAKVARDGIERETEAGERTVFDLLEAEQEYLDAEVRLITARRNAVVSEYTLKSSLGALTAQRLNLDAATVYSPEQHFDDSKHNFFTTKTYEDKP